MKRKIMTVLLAALLLCGCGAGEDPYRIDTVVRIPVNPTEAPTQPETEAAEEPAEISTEAPTEENTETANTEEPTEAPKQSSGGSKESSSGKSSSSGRKSNQEAEPQETEPPATEAPGAETEPPAELSGAEPAMTEPAAGENAETKVPAEVPLYDISGYAPGSLEYAMEAEINAARVSEGLSEIGLDSRLSAIASCRAWELTQLWSHTRPDGRDYATVLGDYGYSAGAATELLVYVTGEGDAVSIVSKWLQSDSHRENLMGGWSSLGIGIFRVNGCVYICCILVG